MNVKTMGKSICVTVLVIFSSLLLFSNQSSAEATGAKIEPALYQQWRQSETKTRVIVELETNASDAEPIPAYRLDVKKGIGTSEKRGERFMRFQQAKQRLLDKVSAKGMVLEPVFILKRFPMMVLDVSKRQAERLAAEDSVKRLHADHLRKPYLASSLPFIGADEYHDEGHGGAGVTVAVLDTAVRFNNGHFGACDEVGSEGCQVVDYENFVDEDFFHVAENSSHGTNVGGIVLGVAPDAKIVSLNVFKYYASVRDYRAPDSAIIAGLNWVAEHKEQYNIVAANMSLGSERTNPGPCNNSSFYEPIRLLYRDYGVATSIASGNEAVPGSLGSPSCVNLAFSTGALYDEFQFLAGSFDCADIGAGAGRMVCFTNLNGMLDFIAPGSDVDAGGLYGFSGTSMAAPHVAGAVALLHSAHEELHDTVAMHRKMMVDALPISYAENIYQQLNLHRATEPKIEAMWNFPEYDKESDETKIHGDGADFSVEFTENGLEENIAPAYLYLEIIHPNPEALRCSLITPDGRQQNFSLPSGTANFNGVIGRKSHFGLFQALRSASPNGTWTLQITDSEGNARGDYLGATLYWTKRDCEGECFQGAARPCGDDRCGMSCGDCSEGGECSALGECLFDKETCPGDSCQGAIEIEPIGETTYQSSTLPCSNDGGGGCGGAFDADKIYTFTLEKNTHFSAKTEGFNSVLYLKREDCEGRDMQCNDDHEALDDGGSWIARFLTPGQYFLFVDGALRHQGDFTLTTKFCTPDCEGRECGSDGCGGNCGEECEEGVCSDEGLCCVPDCEGLECGDDGCGGDCGACGEASICIGGMCELQEEESEIDGDSEIQSENEANDETATHGSGSGESGCRTVQTSSASLWFLLLSAIMFTLRVFSSKASKRLPQARQRA